MSGDRSDQSKVFAGRFEYTKPLGKGAGGAVYLAEDLHSERRRVALKVLSASAYESVQGKMLRREFEILSKLDHSHLVRVYDYGALPEGGVYLAEEYIEGFSLQDARALLEPETLIDVTRQVLLGLAYLHGMGMIHRDVKPANVMLLWFDETANRPLVKLVDFGLSSMDPSRDTLRGGTRSYMAPEIIDGNKGEFRSDLFSLGVTLYYALAGVLPFGPRNKKDPPPTQENINPPPPHRLNPEVPLTLSRFTMVLLRQIEGVTYNDAGEALQALARDTERREWWSGRTFANSLDVAAAPVLRGYFERGILGRRVGERERLVEELSAEDDSSSDSGGGTAGGTELSGRFHLVKGGAEVGKTRLISDVSAGLKIERCRVVRVDCEPEMRPWQLVDELLERIVELGASRGDRTIEYYKSYLLILKRLSMLDSGSEVALSSAVDISLLRRAFHDAVGGFEPERLVLVIDDFHLADRVSRRFFNQCYGGGRALEMPAALATVRTGVEEVELPAGEYVEVHEIEGLTQSDIRRFFEGRLGLEDLEESWLDEIREYASGRPGYLEEVCRTLIDEGLLHRRSVASWFLDREELEDFALPESLRASYRRRFASIGASGREVLELLALYERPVRWESLRSFIESNHDTVGEADQTLQSLSRRYLAKMNIEVDGRYLELVDDVLGEVVLDLMSPSWQRGLHRRIAERLREGWQNGKVDAAEIAYHLDSAGEEKRAAQMYEVAGDRAWSEAEFGRAHHRYGAALEKLQAGPARSSISAKQARVLLTLYESDASRALIAEAGEGAERTGLDWLVNAVCLTGGELSLIRGEDGEVERWISRLEDVLPSASQQAPVLELQAAVARRRGALERCEELLKQALRRVKHFGERTRTARLLARLGDLKEWTGESEEADRLLARAIQEAGSSVAFPADEAEVAFYRASTLRRRGDYKDAIEWFDEALELLSRGYRPDLWIESLFQVALCHVEVGAREQADRYAADAMVFAEEFDDEVLLHRVRFCRAELEYDRAADPESAFQTMKDALHRVRDSNSVVPEMLEMTVRYVELVDRAGGEEESELVDGAERRARAIGATGLTERLGPMGE